MHLHPVVVVDGVEVGPRFQIVALLEEVGAAGSAVPLQGPGSRGLLGAQKARAFVRRFLC